MFSSHLTVTSGAQGNGSSFAGPYSRLEVRNNGRVFATGDWDRITTIASGNPDSASVSDIRQQILATRFKHYAQIERQHFNDQQSCSCSCLQPIQLSITVL
jgi:hypothetical protein